MEHDIIKSLFEGCGLNFAFVRILFLVAIGRSLVEVVDLEIYRRDKPTQASLIENHRTEFNFQRLESIA